MTIKASYKRWQNFPQGAEILHMWSPNSTAKLFQELLAPNNRQRKVNAIILSEGTGVSSHYIRMFEKGNQHNRINVLTLYKLNGILINRERVVKYKSDYKKVKLLNPLYIQRVFRETGITHDMLLAFLQGRFKQDKLKHNLQKKTFNFETLVGITACWQFHNKETKSPSGILLPPNTRRARRKNELIERYRSGDLSPVQPQAGKTS